MSKKANPTVIGAFVIGALAIMTTLILLLSGDMFTKKTVEVIMYFDGSVTGLNVGAPVKFRGVKIGTVTDIKLIIDRASETNSIPVLAEIDRNAYLVKLPSGETVRASEVLLDTKEFVEAGLRAQLQLNSMLTGQLFVEMDVDPGSSYTLRGDGTINEIPTKTSGIQKIIKDLEDFPFDTVLNNITSSIENLNKIISDPAIPETIRSINQTSKDFGTLARELTDQSNNISNNIKTTLDKTNTFLDSADGTMKNANKTLAGAEQMFKTTNDLLSDDSQLIYKLTDTLSELNSAARSVRNLADSIEQQPESLLQGKAGGSN